MYLVRGRRDRKSGAGWPEAADRGDDENALLHLENDVDRLENDCVQTDDDGCQMEKVVLQTNNDGCQMNNAIFRADECGFEKNDTLGLSARPRNSRTRTVDPRHRR